MIKDKETTENLNPTPHVEVLHDVEVESPDTRWEGEGGTVVNDAPDAEDENA